MSNGKTDGYMTCNRICPMGLALLLNIWTSIACRPFPPYRLDAISFGALACRVAIAFGVRCARHGRAIVDIGSEMTTIKTQIKTCTITRPQRFVATKQRGSRARPGDARPLAARCAINRARFSFHFVTVRKWLFVPPAPVVIALTMRNKCPINSHRLHLPRTTSACTRVLAIVHLAGGVVRVYSHSCISCYTNACAFISGAGLTRGERWCDKCRLDRCFAAFSLLRKTSCFQFRPFYFPRELAVGWKKELLQLFLCSHIRRKITNARQ